MSDRLIQIQYEEQDLLNKISELIKQSRTQVANQANSTLTLLFWQIGRNIKEFVLLNKRADYGKQIVSTLSTQLVAMHGKNFEARNLRRMVQFANIYPDIQIVVSLTRQLSWTHIIALIPLQTVEIIMPIK